MTTDLLPPEHTFAGLQRNGYRCVLADAPTKFIAGTKGRPQHYKRMTDLDIATLPVADLLHPEGAWIFFWVTSPKLYVAAKNSKSVLTPDNIARYWGARYSGRAFVWVKIKRSFAKTFDTDTFMNFKTDLHVGMGYGTRKCAEDVLLFRAGSPQRLAKDVHEVIIAPAREHSRKPDEAIRRIERFCPGPRVELFARESRDDWDSWGIERTKFDLPLLEVA